MCVCVFVRQINSKYFHIGHIRRKAYWNNAKRTHYTQKIINYNNKICIIRIEPKKDTLRIFSIRRWRNEIFIAVVFCSTLICCNTKFLFGYEAKSMNGRERSEMNCKWATKILPCELKYIPRTKTKISFFLIYILVNGFNSLSMIAISFAILPGLLTKKNTHPRAHTQNIHSVSKTGWWTNELERGCVTCCNLQLVNMYNEQICVRVC